MRNEELIDALQCTRHFALYQDCYEKNCYANSGKGLYCNIPKLMADAADALEADEKRIAELEAQLPKEGEWIDDNGANVPLDRDGYTTGMCRCSVCGDWLIASDEYEVRGRYCPNCGARMKDHADAD